MMHSIFKRIFILSLLLYIGSTMYTRLSDSDFTFPGNVLYSLPLDAFPLNYWDGSDLISTQIGVLSTTEVEGFLETNPENFPGMEEGLVIDGIGNSKQDQNYLLLRFKNKYHTSWGDIKVYYPYLSKSVKQFIYMSGGMKEYLNILLPYSPYLEKDLKQPQKIEARLENFW